MGGRVCQQPLPLQFPCMEMGSLFSDVFIQLLVHHLRLLCFSFKVKKKKHYGRSKLRKSFLLIQGKDTEQVTDITERWHCLCLPLPPFLSLDGDKFREITLPRPPWYFSVAVILFSNLFQVLVSVGVPQHSLHFSAVVHTEQ